MKAYVLDEHKQVTINSSHIMFLYWLDREALKLVETILHFAKETGMNKFNLDSEKFHSTQKPVELLEYLIKTYTKEGAVVLGNCAGSFSTLVACQNTNRNGIGIELDEKYYNIGVERVINNVKVD